MKLPDHVVEMIAIEAASSIAKHGIGMFNRHIAAPMLPILRQAVRDAADAYTNLITPQKDE